MTSMQNACIIINIVLLFPGCHPACNNGHVHDNWLMDKCRRIYLFCNCCLIMCCQYLDVCSISIEISESGNKSLYFSYKSDDEFPRITSED